MKRTTRKFSGQAKDRFLARFLAQEPGLPPDVAAGLLARSKAALTSVRVKRSALAGLGSGRIIARTGERLTTAQQAAGPSQVAKTDRQAPTTTPVTVQATGPADTGAPNQGAVTPVAFDPYSIGLVPVFQREGRDGLMKRLHGVASVAHLRQMAKAQQIVVPQEMRSGDIDAAVLCDAIADAVERRIADRRAAAG